VLFCLETNSNTQFHIQVPSITITASFLKKLRSTRKPITSYTQLVPKVLHIAIRTKECQQLSFLPESRKPLCLGPLLLPYTFPLFPGERAKATVGAGGPVTLPTTAAHRSVLNIISSKFTPSFQNSCTGQPACCRIIFTRQPPCFPKTWEGESSGGYRVTVARHTGCSKSIKTRTYILFNYSI